MAEFISEEGFQIAVQVILPTAFVAMLAVSVWRKRWQIAVPTLLQYITFLQYARFSCLVDFSQSKDALSLCKAVDISLRQYRPASIDLAGMHSNFEDAGVSSPVFLENTVLLSVIVAVWILVQLILVVVIRNKPTYSSHGLFIAMTWLLILYCFDGLAFGFLQMSQWTSASENYELVTVWFSCIMTVTCLVSIAYVCYKLLIISPHNPVPDPVFNSILQEMRWSLKGALSLQYYTLFLVSRTALAAAFVFLSAHPMTQGLLQITLQLLFGKTYTGYYIAVVQPFRVSKVNWLNFFVEVCVLGLVLCNAAYQFTDEYLALDLCLLFWLLAGITVIVLKFVWVHKSSQTLPKNPEIATRMEPQTQPKPKPTNVGIPGARSQRPYEDFRKVYGTEYTFQERRIAARKLSIRDIDPGRSQRLPQY